MMKFLCTFLACIGVLIIQAQCPNDNTVMWDITPTGPGETQTTFCAWGGESYPFNVVLGETYEISTCGGSWDSQITLYDQGGGFLGFQ